MPVDVAHPEPCPLVVDASATAWRLPVSRDREAIDLVAGVTSLLSASSVHVCAFVPTTTRAAACASRLRSQNDAVETRSCLVYDFVFLGASNPDVVCQKTPRARPAIERQVEPFQHALRHRSERLEIVEGSPGLALGVFQVAAPLAVPGLLRDVARLVALADREGFRLRGARSSSDAAKSGVPGVRFRPYSYGRLRSMYGVCEPLELLVIGVGRHELPQISPARPAARTSLRRSSLRDRPRLAITCSPLRASDPQVPCRSSAACRDLRGHSLALKIGACTADAYSVTPVDPHRPRRRSPPSRARARAPTGRRRRSSRRARRRPRSALTPCAPSVLASPPTDPGAPVHKPPSRRAAQ